MNDSIRMNTENHNANVHMSEQTCMICGKKDEQILLGDISWESECQSCGLKHYDPDKKKKCKNCGSYNLKYTDVSNQKTITLPDNICEDCENNTDHLIVIEKSTGRFITLSKEGRDYFLTQITDRKLVESIKGILMVDNTTFELLTGETNEN